MTAITDTGDRAQTNARRRRSALINSIEYAIERVERESKLANQFNPSSYTCGALNAVNALRVLVTRLRDEKDL
jgi:hypothetical protein